MLWRPLAVGRYTAEGLQRTLTAWYDAIGGPAADPREITQARCHRWIAERRRLGDRTDLELPRDKEVWTRFFGGWMQALATAGLLAHRGQAGIRTRFGALKATDETLINDLRSVAEALECVPTVRRFDEWVVAERSRAAERNEVIDLYQSEAYQRRFGSWGRALRLADLITDAELLERIGRSSQEPYTDDEALAFVKQYLAVCDPEQCSGAQYTTWRQQTIATNAAAGRAQAIPSERYLRGRFGSFKQAVTLSQHSTSDKAQES